MSNEITAAVSPFLIAWEVEANAWVIEKHKRRAIRLVVNCSSRFIMDE